MHHSVPGPELGQQLAGVPDVQLRRQLVHAFFRRSLAV